MVALSLLIAGVILVAFLSEYRRIGGSSKEDKK